MVRLGSTTQLNTSGNFVEINSVESIKNSASKLLMKQCFQTADVKTAKWGVAENLEKLVILANELTSGWKNRLVCKSHMGSRGLGNTLINNEDELLAWTNGKNLNNYIFEKYYNYSREYRLHITEHGCFYTCRKMLKEETPDNERWFRNNFNSIWVVEENLLFNKPTNWQEVVDECVKALKAIGADLLCFDVKMSSKDGSFILLESNSGPSFGTITLEKYLEEIPKIINRKLVEENGA